MGFFGWLGLTLMLFGGRARGEILSGFSSGVVAALLAALCGSICNQFNQPGEHLKPELWMIYSAGSSSQ